MLSNDEIRKNIQQRIKECREEKGMSQTELGEAFGKAKTTIATWEQGKTAPDAATLYRLAVYFEKTLAFMYGDDKDETT